MSDPQSGRLAHLVAVLKELTAASQACRLAVDKADRALAAAKPVSVSIEEATAAVHGASASLAALVRASDDGLRRLISELEYIEERHQTGAKIVRAQEDERRRVAREIHDGPAQTMTNVVLRAEICERLMSRDSERLESELTELKRTVKDALAEIRRIIGDLRPMALDDLGLVPAVRQYYEDLAKRCKWAGGVVVENERQVSGTTEVAVFRLVQEALQNARKHSEATRVDVSLEFRDDSIFVKVVDNGKGFDTVRASLSKVGREKFGIVGMRERASLLGGSFRVDSSPGAGTSITAVIPTLL